MNPLFCRTLVVFGCLVAITVVQSWWSGHVLAQESGQERASAGAEPVKIQPYTGDPIFLDEPEQIAAPTLVRRDKRQEKYDGTEQLRVEQEIAQFSDNHIEADGVYREFYPDGQLFVEGRYRNGRQHGEWTYFFENGQVNRKSTFNNGRPDGEREIFRDDGTLHSKRAYKDGVRQGEWITYDETGKQPLREEHYVDGKADGVWKTWFPNGQLRQQISFKQGTRHGTSSEWDEKGQKRAEINYVDNKLHGAATRWFADGRRVVQQYEDGKLISQSSG